MGIWLGRSRRESRREDEDADGERGGEEPVFDRVALLERLDGAEDLVEQLVAMFIASASSHIPALQDALARRSASEIVFQSHTLAGTSANVGAVRMQRIAAELESLAKAGSLDELPRLCQQLQDALTPFKAVSLDAAKETV